MLEVLERYQAQEKIRKVSPAVAALERLHELAERSLPTRKAVLPGDDGFRAFLNAAFEAGHLTEQELRERRLLHCQIVGARPPAGEASIFAELRELIAEGVLIEKDETS